MSFIQKFKRKPRKNITFVMLTWNRSNMLAIALNALFNSIEDKKNAEIIIFDNASTDSTKEIILQFYQEHHQEIQINYYLSKINWRLSAYKFLFWKARGKIVVEVDDDVLEQPKGLDRIFIDYFNRFGKMFSVLSLNVIQNEHTDGAKPSENNYINVSIGDHIVQSGPAGGWCLGYQRHEFRKIRWHFMFSKISMKHGEDGRLCELFSKKLGKSYGIIKNYYCFHASGPYYSQQFSLLDRDIEKYRIAELNQNADNYQNYK